MSARARAALALLTLGACQASRPDLDESPTALPHAAAAVVRARYAPARDLGPLFHDVQTSGVFEDSKTFVDARPRRAPAEILAEWERSRGVPGFSLRAFVRREFEAPADAGADVRTDTTRTMVRPTPDRVPE